jgi:hypothetical protein
MDATVGRVWEVAAPLAENEGMEIVDIELPRRSVAGASCVVS